MFLCRTFLSLISFFFFYNFFKDSKGFWM
jgi:hypothetical protein